MVSREAFFNAKNFTPHIQSLLLIFVLSTK